MANRKPIAMRAKPRDEVCFMLLGSRSTDDGDVFRETKTEGNETLLTPAGNYKSRRRPPAPRQPENSARFLWPADTANPCDRSNSFLLLCLSGSADYNVKNSRNISSSMPIIHCGYVY